MVAPDAERLRQAGEDAAAVVADGGGAPVHRRVGARNLDPEGLADALVAEADAEDGDPPGKRPHRFG